MLAKKIIMDEARKRRDKFVEEVGKEIGYKMDNPELQYLKALSFGLAVSEITENEEDIEFFKNLVDKEVLNLL